jgi:membrane protein implicated in regulation of membrane protease activity
VASFITTFGGIGIITTQFFRVKPEWSLVFATTGGLLVSGLMYLFYSQFLIRSQGSSEIRQADLIGLQAEVTVPIGETSMGQVTYLTKSGRMSSMARSIDGKAIPRGQFVVILRAIGPQVLVRPIAMDTEE